MQLGSRTANITETSLCDSFTGGSISFTFDHAEAGKKMYGWSATGQASFCVIQIKPLHVLQNVRARSCGSGLQIAVGRTWRVLEASSVALGGNSVVDPASKRRPD